VRVEFHTRRSDGTRVAVYQKRVLFAMKSEIRIISYGQGVCTQRNRTSILKERSLPVIILLHSIKRLLVCYFWAECALTLGTFREECKCVVCAEAVHMEGLKLSVHLH
jgi:hypothetical protein